MLRLAEQLPQVGKLFKAEHQPAFHTFLQLRDQLQAAFDGFFVRQGAQLPGFGASQRAVAQVCHLFGERGILKIRVEFGIVHLLLPDCSSWAFLSAFILSMTFR